MAHRLDREEKLRDISCGCDNMHAKCGECFKILSCTSVQVLFQTSLR